ncbi:hypothetical protein VP01_4922g1 [Puccinia sorghi]|uniref:Uncharacterized protein n=1 Tax=Puccinia sorghi TaxID=27349 RepID=A0A0L6UP21_9BASI|nr:hypothetical protein VP01_4922g1 [Puccinia sorghi]
MKLTNWLRKYMWSNWDLSILPSKKNPPIFIGLTESWHFVVLKMIYEHLFPEAQLEKNWEQIATPEAVQWNNMYLRCFELTQILKLETVFDKFTFQLKLLSFLSSYFS